MNVDPLSAYAWEQSPIHRRRMDRFLNAGLYVVTSESVSGGRDTESIVRAALDGGVRLFQLREKNMPPAQLISLARRVRAMTIEADALLIINDRLDVALAAGADGVHLGQEDFPIAEARRLAPDLIFGASTHCAEEAERAVGEGASYVNIGPLFPTGTKTWNGEYLGLDRLRSISAHVDIPFTVMGGIKLDHIPDLVACGARTLAVVTAVTAATDPAGAARELLGAIRACRGVDCV